MELNNTAGIYHALTGIGHQLHASFCNLTTTLNANVHVILTSIHGSQEELKISQERNFDMQTELLSLMMNDLHEIKKSLARIEEKQSELEDRLDEMDTTLDHVKETTDGVECTVSEIQGTVGEIEDTIGSD
jgi:chromosome segregation ATPase